MIIYLSYLVLIFCVLKFYKNNSDNDLLISSGLITVGIYIINLVIPKTKENFTWITDVNKRCNNESDCQSKICSNNKCRDLQENNIACFHDNNCKSGHCIKESGTADIASVCRTTQNNGEKCVKDNDCNEYDSNSNTYDNNKKCSGDGKCHKKK